MRFYSLSSHAQPCCRLGVFILMLGLWYIQPPLLLAQQISFTRITDGDFVNGGGNSAGSCWIDYDNDGKLDLFVANGNITVQNNQLFRSNGDGSFTTIANSPLVSDGGASIGGSWGDYDNDGDPDLFVPNRENINNFLYRNEGGGNFTPVTAGAIVTDGGNSNLSAWLDVENDGDLDLFVLNFNQANFLYLNDGNGNFTRETASLIVTEVTPSICCTWGDYDNDGDLDLFVANGGSQNNILYVNQGNLLFSKITFDDGASSLGCSWGDYDNDGDLDLFVANFLNTNNILYRNDGAPGYSFTRITDGAIVHDGGSTIGSGWGDFDNDGDLDLIATNSFGQNAFLYANNGDGSFTRITGGAIVNDGGNTFGVSMSDYDRDGDLDIYMTNIDNQNNFFYRNDGAAARWVMLQCRGSDSNRSAVGTKVRLKAVINGTPMWQLREVAAQHGYNSQNSYFLHFGLGDAVTIDSLRLEWPSGTVEVLTHLAAGQYYTIREGQGLVGLVPAEEATSPGDFSLAQNYPNPFNPQTTIRYRLAESTAANLTVYTALGQPVRTLIDGPQPAGWQEVTWDGRDGRGRQAGSGVYLYRLRTANYSETRQMVLAR